MKRQRRNYPKDFKRDAVALVTEQGYSIAEASRSLDIGPKFNAPQSDRLVAYDDAAFSQEVFDISVAEIEAIVEPSSITDYIWRKSMALSSIHWPNLPVTTG